MKSVSMKEARQRFARLIDDAQRGKTMMITRRGRQVAKIVPADNRAPGPMPDMTAFRAGIRVQGEPLSEIVVAQRRSARY